MSGPLTFTPPAWPQCPECGLPWVMRRSLRFTPAGPSAITPEWLWQRDCKHRKVEPIIAEAS